jgi:hypothetical protein
MTKRPKFQVNDSELSELTSRLAESRAERMAFTSNPQDYLSRIGVDVSNNCLVGAGSETTSELCTAVALCVVAVAIGVVAVTGAAVGIYVAAGFAVATYAAVYTSVVSSTSTVGR